MVSHQGYLLSEDLEIDSKQVKNDTNQTDSNLVLLEINLRIQDSDLTDKALQIFKQSWRCKDKSQADYPSFPL